MMTHAKANARAELVLSFEEAEKLVGEHAALALKRTRSIEELPLLDSLGRTLAEDIVADRDFPPFPRATRDGYAVRSIDIQSVPADLLIAGEIRAGGTLPSGFAKLKPGEAVSIMTGAPVPDGADAVIMVEHTERKGSLVLVSRSVSAGENIVPRGSEARADAVLVSCGEIVSHAQVALAAAVGRSRVRVWARPRVAILPTGDEVVDIDAQPDANQIRNSNSFSLAAQVIACGGEPVQLPVAPDQPERLRDLIARGLDSDLLLLSGGVSAGEYDLVEDTLAPFSAEFLFTGVQMQPGKPLVFGRARAAKNRDLTYFFGLPGNPISTMVTFTLFARTMIRALSGAIPVSVSTFNARLARPVRVKTGLTRFLPARSSGKWNDVQVEQVKWQGSGDIAAFARADCLLVVPPDREQFEAGETMCVVPLV